MPRFDRTGPMGSGSMTGRGAGYCATNATPNRAMSNNFMYGRGGRGRRSCYYGMGRRQWVGMGDSNVVANAQEEKDLLLNQVELLKRQLQAVEGRIQTIEAKE